jgi:ferredoxin-NADP reductase
VAGAAVLERLTVPRAPVLWRVARVREIVEETASAVTLVLDVDGWPGHVAGQHLDVRLTADDGYQAERSYSIASAASGERVELTIEELEDGEVSPYLTEELRIGDKLELRGPIGGYFAWDASRGGPLFLVAGGSGIVPLMAMLRHRAAVGSQIPARLLYSSRAYDDIIYRAELDRLSAGDANLEVIHTLTRSQPPGWNGLNRRIDPMMLAEVAWSPKATPHIFVCGPTRLVESVATALVGLGHDPARVKTERFGPTGGS